ncbi:MAG: tetratricopeptide repeat protein [Blastocatellia bacterium]
MAAPAYKPRAILTLAATYLDAGDASESAALCVEALRASRGTDVLSDLQALRNIAVTQAIRGDHKAALAMLESPLPTARSLNVWYPADFLCHLNSLAIELGEVGRVEEANRVIDLVLRSPFAKNRPQWHDTKVELATKSRLVFTPFTLAIGARAETEEARTEDRQHLEPSIALTVATDVQQESGRPRSQEAAGRNRRIEELKTSPDSAIGLFPIGTQSSMRSAAILPVLQAEPARLGYAISPPARAPPSGLPTLKAL